MKSMLFSHDMKNLILPVDFQAHPAPLTRRPRPARTDKRVAAFGQKTAFIAIFGQAVLLAGPAQGVVMLSGSNDQDYKNYGATFAAVNKVAAFRVLASGSLPEIYASATPIN